MMYIEENGLCKKERVPPEFVGVHHANRMGIMLDALRCQELLHTFVLKGFAMSEALKALGCEPPPAATKEGSCAATSTN